MDLWGALQVKNPTRSPLFFAGDYSIPSVRLGCWAAREKKTIRLPEISVSSRKLCSRSLVVRAKGNKNNNNISNSDDDSSTSFSSSSSSSPFENSDGDVSKGKKSTDGSKRQESSSSSSQKPILANLDWREFRASLFAKEQQAQKSQTEDHNSSQTGALQEPKPLPSKWAHPLSFPENGCILVATKELDGSRDFARTVVLLLGSGTSHPQEGPYGVIINRPLNITIRHMRPNNNYLTTTFSDCSLHFGGPLEEASVFLLSTGVNKAKLPGFKQVIPGLYLGVRDSLDGAATLVKNGVLKPQDFRFFVGYSGWEVDQLSQEIEAGYWYVAACSSNLVCGGSTSLMVESGDLWEEILQLMGGDYSELSQ